VTAEVAAYPSLSDDECFALCVMSHGQLCIPPGDKGVSECVLGTDGIPVPTTSLLAPFSKGRCPLLHGKPKIVIIQACRGGLYCKAVCT